MTAACAACGPTAGALAFELPPGRIATAPAEVRGAGRDDVALMVGRVGDGSLIDVRFPTLAGLLAPGDLVVVNTSATLAAALPGRLADGATLRLHLSTSLDDGTWVVEVREPHGSGSAPWSSGRPAADLVGSAFSLPAGGRAELVAPYPSREALTSRLWTAALDVPSPVDEYLGSHGEPIRYGADVRAWPLSAYQTVYATEPGSAEMPSAGRAFTSEMLTRLVSLGVGVAPVVLHAGVSSPEDHEPPYPERYRVPAHTASWVNAARAGGGRVVAVGTTVVRALETAVGGDGVVRASEGWTHVVIGPERPVKVVDGLLTGWHEPGASHLRLLEAVGGRPLLEAAYARGVEGDYLWHEFGDLLLILP